MLQAVRVVARDVLVFFCLFGVGKYVIAVCTDKQIKFIALLIFSVSFYAAIVCLIKGENELLESLVAEVGNACPHAGADLLSQPHLALLVAEKLVKGLALLLVDLLIEAPVLGKTIPRAISIHTFQYVQQP